MNTNRQFRVIATLLCAAATEYARAQPSFEELSALSAGHGAYPAAMSADGSIIVGYDSGAVSLPVRWAGGVVSAVPLPSGSSYGDATGISAAGDVIVGGAGGGSFRWDAIGGSVRLNNGGGGSYPIPIAKCVGGSELFGRAMSASSSYAMRWHNGIQAIGISASFAAVSGASADGTVAVGSTIGDYACRWSAPDTVETHSTGTFPRSSATAVSADGRVTVGSLWNTVDGSDAQAFQWIRGGAFQELARPAGATAARALAVNGDGRVIVGKYVAGGQSKAAIWTAAGAFDFGAVLAPYDIVPQGWVLKELNAVSSDGMTIAGWGGPGATAVAFVVHLPTMCYANCDASTAAPFLNINDFQCFVGKFAAGDLYANCDGSTLPPVLNVNDFQCFMNKFVAGCE